MTNSTTCVYNTKNLGEENKISAASAKKAIKSKGFTNVKYTTK
jgi:hypothetical protein